jgi:hypothetical protein
MAKIVAGDHVRVRRRSYYQRPGETGVVEAVERRPAECYVRYADGYAELVNTEDAIRLGEYARGQDCPSCGHWVYGDECGHCGRFLDD